MGLRFSRRKMMQGVGGVTLANSLPVAEAAPAARRWPIERWSGHAKICLAPGDGGRPLPANLQPPAPSAAPATGRGPGGGFGGGFGSIWQPSQTPLRPRSLRLPDKEAEEVSTSTCGGLSANPATGRESPAWCWHQRRAMDRGKCAPRSPDRQRRGTGGLQLDDQRPEQRSVREGVPSQGHGTLLASIEAAGKGGLTVVEYNFYAHRAIEGYYETIGRAKAGYTGFDHELELLINENGMVVQPIYRDEHGQITPETLAAFPNAKKVKFKDLPPLANEGVHTLDEMWANITYFLKAAVPAAEKAGVRLALHPNDPPSPISRGSRQVMGSLAGWKHLIEIVKSPANGITYDSGVTREMGEDPVAVAEYFGSRKRNQSRSFPQRAGGEAVREVPRGVYRRGHGRHVRRDEGTRAE